MKRVWILCIIWTTFRLVIQPLESQVYWGKVCGIASIIVLWWICSFWKIATILLFLREVALEISQWSFKRRIIMKYRANPFWSKRVLPVLYTRKEQKQGSHLLFRRREGIQRGNYFLMCKNRVFVFIREIVCVELGWVLEQEKWIKFNRRNKG